MEKMVNLYKVLSGIEYEVQLEGKSIVDVNEILVHSNQVYDGTMFVALVGAKVDGHKFLLDAYKKGAKFLVINKNKLNDVDISCFHDITLVTVNNTRECLSKMINNFYEDPSKQFTLVGVTGTNGKTSVTKMAQYLFMKQEYKTGLIGTIDNYVDNEILSIEKTTPTTPDCVELGKIMDKFVEEKVDYCFMEVSSMALKTHRVSACDFDLAVFTNLSPEHLDDHKTMEDYVESKLKLFTMTNKAVINMDNEYSQKVLSSFTGNSIRYGIQQTSLCNLYAKNIEYYNDKVKFLVVYKKNNNLNQESCSSIEYPMTIYTPSEFAVYNNLAVIGIGLMCGLEFTRIIDCLSEKIYIDGRYEVITGEKPFTVIVDYAHTAFALENILKAVRKNKSYKRIITVFGCGGNRDKSKRSVMGRISQALSDYTIITSDNPRTEPPKAIIEDILEGMDESSGNYTYMRERKAAIEHAVFLAQENDVIVIIGKGHEREQIFNGYSVPFSDKEVAINAMKVREKSYQLG